MPVLRPERGIKRIVVGRAGAVVGEDARRLSGGDAHALAAGNGPAQGPGGSLAESRPQLEHLRLGDEVVHVRVLDNRRRAASEALAEGRIGPAERRLEERLHWNGGVAGAGR